ncbi:MAG: hypothetical protein U1E60_15835 [Reyranellaceae bacterium]
MPGHAMIAPATSVVNSRRRICFLVEKRAAGYHNLNENDVVRRSKIRRATLGAGKFIVIAVFGSSSACADSGHWHVQPLYAVQKEGGFRKRRLLSRITHNTALLQVAGLATQAQMLRMRKLASPWATKMPTIATRCATPRS